MYQTTVKTKVRRACTLIASLLVVGCSGAPKNPVIEQYEAAISQLIGCVQPVINDQTRAAAAISKIRAADELMREARTRRSAQLEQLVALNADYHASREQFDAVLSQRAAYVDAQQAALISMFDEYHALLTDAERSACLTERREYAQASLAFLREY